MINQKDIYVGLNLPSNNEPLWIKPLTDGNVALYARVYGEWIAANSHALYYTKAETDALLAGKVDATLIQDGYTASRYMSGTSFSDNSDPQGRVRTAAYEVGGITLVDLNGNIAILQVDGTLKLNGKAIATEDDTALLVNDGDYNSQTKEIELKHGNTVLARIDATAFIKDGMVDNVTISNGNLVITFNTDAGKESISLSITDIFNPANYYDKTAVDTLLSGKVDKEAGKGLSTNDYDNNAKTLITNIQAIPTSKSLTINGATISFNQDGTVTWDKPVTSVTIDPSVTQNIHIGDEFLVTATVSPSDARDTSLTWTSSNTSVVSISDGTDANSKYLYGESLGLATITCTSNADSSKYASITVNVVKRAVTGVSLNKNSVSMMVNQSDTLTATVSPSNADDKTVTWSTSNSSIVSISPNGTTCSISSGSTAGTATVTCTSNDDSSKKATCTVTVQAAPTPTLNIIKGATMYEYAADGSPAADGRCYFSKPSDVTPRFEWRSWVSGDPADIFIVGNAGDFNKAGLLNAKVYIDNTLVSHSVTYIGDSTSQYADYVQPIYDRYPNAIVAYITIGDVTLYEQQNLDWDDPVYNTFKIKNSSGTTTYTEINVAWGLNSGTTLGLGDVLVNGEDI